MGCRGVDVPEAGREEAGVGVREMDTIFIFCFPDKEEPEEVRDRILCPVSCAGRNCGRLADPGPVLVGVVVPLAREGKAPSARLASSTSLCLSRSSFSSV